MQIAVAIDGSKNALRAAKHAIMLVKYLPNATLTLLFVIDYDNAKQDYLLAQNGETFSSQRAHKVQPAVDLASAENITAEVVMLEGKPSEEIIRYANDNAVDHVIIGSRGLNTLQEMMLGSVSHKVLKHVQCPVTIIK